PRVAFAEIIGDAADVFRLNFVDPQRGERCQRGANGIGRARRVQRAGWIPGRLNVLVAPNAAAGEPDGQDVAVGARQIPIAQGVGRVGEERPQVLPNGRSQGGAGGAGNDVQTVIAGVFDRAAGGGTAQIR